MKYTIVVVLVLAMCVAAMAARPKKFKRKGSRCSKTFEYSECVNNTMTRTIASVEKDGCKSITPKVKEIQCVYTKNKTKNGCTIQQEFNFTDCGLPSSSGKQEKTVKITVSGDGQDCKAFTETHTSECDSKPKKGVGKVWKKQVGNKKGGNKEGKRKAKMQKKRLNKKRKEKMNKNQ